jgi:hypothetical protein
MDEYVSTNNVLETEMDDILIACHCKNKHQRILPLSKNQPPDFYNENLLSNEIMKKLNIRSISFIDTDPDCLPFHEEVFHQYNNWEEIPENSFDKIFEINCPYVPSFPDEEILSKILKPNGNFYATKKLTFRPKQVFMEPNDEEAIHWRYYIDSENNIFGYLERGIDITKILQRRLIVLTNKKDNPSAMIRGGDRKRKKHRNKHYRTRRRPKIRTKQKLRTRRRTK